MQVINNSKVDTTLDILQAQTPSVENFIEYLDDFVLLKIFNYISGPDASKLSLVSKRWRILVSKKEFWQPAFINDFPDTFKRSPQEFISYKEAYKEALRINRNIVESICLDVAVNIESCYGIFNFKNKAVFSKARNNGDLKYFDLEKGVDKINNSLEIKTTRFNNAIFINSKVYEEQFFINFTNSLSIVGLAADLLVEKKKLLCNQIHAGGATLKHFDFYESKLYMQFSDHSVISLIRNGDEYKIDTVHESIKVGHESEHWNLYSDLGLKGWLYHNSIIQLAPGGWFLRILNLEQKSKTVELICKDKPFNIRAIQDCWLFSGVETNEITEKGEAVKQIEVWDLGIRKKLNVTFKYVDPVGSTTINQLQVYDDKLFGVVEFNNYLHSQIYVWKWKTGQLKKIINLNGKVNSFTYVNNKICVSSNLGAKGDFVGLTNFDVVQPIEQTKPKKRKVEALNN